MKGTQKDPDTIRKGGAPSVDESAAITNDLARAALVEDMKAFVGRLKEHEMDAAGHQSDEGFILSGNEIKLLLNLK